MPDPWYFQPEEEEELEEEEEAEWDEDFCGECNSYRDLYELELCKVSKRGIICYSCCEKYKEEKKCGHHECELF
jgi:hypothetical protein